MGLVLVSDEERAHIQLEDFSYRKTGDVRCPGRKRGRERFGIPSAALATDGAIKRFALSKTGHTWAECYWGAVLWTGNRLSSMWELIAQGHGHCDGWSQSTCNVAEYDALIHGLKMARDMGVRRLLCYSDSKLVVNTMNEQWELHKPHLQVMRTEARLARRGMKVKFRWHPRENGRAVLADAVADLGFEEHKARDPAYAAYRQVR